MINAALEKLKKETTLFIEGMRNDPYIEHADFRIVNERRFTEEPQLTKDEFIEGKDRRCEHAAAAFALSVEKMAFHEQFEQASAQFWRSSGAILAQFCAILLTPLLPSGRDVGACGDEDEHPVGPAARQPQEGREGARPQVQEGGHAPAPPAALPREQRGPRGRRGREQPQQRRGAQQQRGGRRRRERRRGRRREGDADGGAPLRVLRALADHRAVGQAPPREGGARGARARLRDEPRVSQGAGGAAPRLGRRAPRRPPRPRAREVAREQGALELCGREDARISPLDVARPRRAERQAERAHGALGGVQGGAAPRDQEARKAGEEDRGTMGRVSDTAHDGPHLTPHPLPLQANLKKIEKANPSVSRAVQTRYMAALLLRKQDHVVEEMQV